MVEFRQRVLALDTNFVKLPASLMLEYMGPFHSKTRSVLRAIVSHPTTEFDLGKIARSIGMEFDDLDGPLRGIAARTQHIFGVNAYLIRIDGTSASITPETYATLREFFAARDVAA